MHSGDFLVVVLKICAFSEINRVIANISFLGQNIFQKCVLFRGGDLKNVHASCEYKVTLREATTKSNYF